ncbi:MAG: HPP family protein [Alphaproteobacteria bacterium]|nr:HPP family protein [Alphaproteobacteria bacterium]
MFQKGFIRTLISASWSGLAAFLSIAIVQIMNQRMIFLSPADVMPLIGSLGASAVLLYAAPHSPLTQPANLVGGHVISAIVGVTVFRFMGDSNWYAAGVAVAVAIWAMEMSGTLHPPGGATALIAVIGSKSVHALGYLYVLYPIASGAIVLLVVAIIMNRLAPGRRYPEWWWKPGVPIDPGDCLWGWTTPAVSNTSGKNKVPPQPM